MILLLLLASPDAAIVDRIAGEYRHAGTKDAQAIEAAIDGVVSEMMWLSRSIARRRLLSTNEIPKKLKIERDGDRIRIAFDGRMRETSIGADPLRVIGIDGGELDYTLDVSGGKLVQRFEGKSGGQVNAIRADGDDLIVRVTVFSARLPANLVYELRYARQ